MQPTQNSPNFASSVAEFQPGGFITPTELPVTRFVMQPLVMSQSNTYPSSSAVATPAVRDAAAVNMLAATSNVLPTTSSFVQQTYRLVPPTPAVPVVPITTATTMMATPVPAVTTARSFAPITPTYLPVPVPAVPAAPIPPTVGVEPRGERLRGLLRRLRMPRRRARTPASTAPAAGVMPVQPLMNQQGPVPLPYTSRTVTTSTTTPLSKPQTLPDWQRTAPVVSSYTRVERRTVAPPQSAGQPPVLVRSVSWVPERQAVQDASGGAKFLSEIRSFDRAALQPVASPVRERPSLPRALQQEIQSFNRRKLRPTQSRAPAPVPSSWTRHFQPQQHMKQQVLPQIRSFQPQQLRTARPRPALPAKVRVAIHLYNRSLLRRIRHWSPYKGMPFLRDIRSFNRPLWLRSFRPEKTPHALLSEIRCFNKRRLRSARPRSPWPEEVLQSVRQVGQRNLRKPFSRNISQWEKRRERRLPAEVQNEIVSRPLRAQFKPITIPPFSCIASVRVLQPAPGDQRRRSLPEDLQGEIRNFNPTRLRSAHPLRKRRPRPFANDIKSFDRRKLHSARTVESRQPVDETTLVKKQRKLPFLQQILTFERRRLRHAVTRVSNQPVPDSIRVSRRKQPSKWSKNSNAAKSPREPKKAVVLPGEWYKSGVPYLTKSHNRSDFA